MKITKITIYTEDGRETTLIPNESHDVSFISQPVVNKICIDGSIPIPVSINSITAIIIHSKNISTERMARAIKESTI